MIRKTFEILSLALLVISILSLTNVFAGGKPPTLQPVTLKVTIVDDSAEYNTIRSDGGGEYINGESGVSAQIDSNGYLAINFGSRPVLFDYSQFRYDYYNSCYSMPWPSAGITCYYGNPFAVDSTTNPPKPAPFKINGSPSEGYVSGVSIKTYKDPSYSNQTYIPLQNLTTNSEVIGLLWTFSAVNGTWNTSFHAGLGMLEGSPAWAANVTCNAVTSGTCSQWTIEPVAVGTSDPSDQIALLNYITTDTITTKVGNKIVTTITQVNNPSGFFKVPFKLILSAK
jgi:hypothetical protein